MFIITLSDTPKEPSRVLGVLGQSGEVSVCECTLAVRTFACKSHTLTLRNYRLTLDLLEHALAMPWWPEEAPPALRPLTVVPVHERAEAVYADRYDRRYSRGK